MMMVVVKKTVERSGSLARNAGTDQLCTGSCFGGQLTHQGAIGFPLKHLSQPSTLCRQGDKSHNAHRRIHIRLGGTPIIKFVIQSYYNQRPSLPKSFNSKSSFHPTSSRNNNIISHMFVVKYIEEEFQPASQNICTVLYI